MRPVIGITSYAEEIRWGVWTEEAALIDPSISPDSISWKYTPPEFALLEPAKEIPIQITKVIPGRVVPVIGELDGLASGAAAAFTFG